MKHSIFFILLIFAGSHLGQISQAGTEKPLRWDLKSCIRYARENNLQVQQARITTETGALTLQQSKEALYPNLNASSSMGVSHYQTDGSGSSSSYGINTSMTLYDGMKNYNTIRQNKLKLTAASLDEEVTANQIEISITEAYLEMLYAYENIETAKRTVETSKAQVELSQNLLNAGSIAKADLAQVQSQYAGDLYTLVTAQNDGETCRLNLKQLLELEITDAFEVVIPVLEESDVLKSLPSKAEVYRTALAVMPEIKSSTLNVQVSEYDLKNAKSSYYPTLSLNGSLETSAGLSTDFASQFGDNFNQYLGLSLSIPIYDKGATKTSVQKAKLSIQSAKLEYTSAQKTLLKTVESLYQDVLASQSKYLAAKEQLKAAEESYKLTKEQYQLNMKNTVELLTAKDTYLSAEQTLSQAKYGAVLSLKLLQFYQNIPIEL
jgi:outer membrane protein